MKTLLLICLLFSSITFSQMVNPDGPGPSIHFTPYFNWGTYEDKVIGVNFDYEPRLSLAFLIKMPLTDFFTLSLFYDNSPFQIIPQNNAGINYEVVAYGTRNNAGIRFSYYLH